MSKRILFTAFCAKLGLRLTKAQYVLARVCFDGVDPRDLSEEHQRIARELFGDIRYASARARRVLALRLGRRSGKTTLAGAYVVFVLLTADLSKCGVGDVPTVAVIAPDRPTSLLCVRMAREMIRRVPELDALIEADTQEGFTLRRPDVREGDADKLVACESFAASRFGGTLRGRTLLSFVIDEADYLPADETGNALITDRYIFGAFMPSLVEGGKAILISTPLPGVPTLMAEIVGTNFGAPERALVAIGPTLLMRDNSPHIASIIADERARDPAAAAREYDCSADGDALSNFFDAGAISRSVDRDLVIPGVASGLAYAGADFAFDRDHSAIVIVGASGGRFSVLAITELRPTKKQALRPSVVVANFADLARRYRCNAIHADAYARATVAEHLGPHGLTLRLAPGGIEGKAKMHLTAKKLFAEGKVRLPNHPRLLAQLRAVVSKPKAGGGITLTSPRRAGDGHGDLVSALVVACHAASVVGSARFHSASVGSRTARDAAAVDFFTLDPHRDRPG